MKAWREVEMPMESGEELRLGPDSLRWATVSLPDHQHAVIVFADTQSEADRRADCIAAALAMMGGAR